MSRTQAELRFKVIAILTGLGVGSVPSAEDAASVDGYSQDAVDELSSKNIVYVQDLDDIPGELFLTFAEYVANAAADEFGGKSDPQRKRFLENELRNIARQTPGFGPQQVEYF